MVETGIAMGWSTPASAVTCESSGMGLGDSALGWSGYWTVLGGESTLRSDGTKKIAINQTNLASLYDQLIEHVTPEEAQFVLAWRLAPATYNDAPSAEELRSQKSKSAAERESGFQKRLREQMSGASNSQSGSQGISKKEVVSSWGGPTSSYSIPGFALSMFSADRN